MTSLQDQQKAAQYIKRQFAAGRAIQSGVVVTFRARHEDTAERFISAVKEVGGVIRDVEETYLLLGETDSIRCTHEVVAYLPNTKY
jgi:hypothetical protein